MRNIIDTLFFTEILQGMGVTLKHMFKKPVTLKYPFENRLSLTDLEGYTTSKLTKRVTQNVLVAIFVKRYALLNVSI